MCHKSKFSRWYILVSSQLNGDYMVACLYNAQLLVSMHRVVSDKLGHYKKGFDKYFRNGGAKLSHGVPIACKKYGLKYNNNHIERDQRRIRQFSNPKGSFQDHRSAEEQLSLYDSFHNYIFPHPGLRGRTPAETAGIHLSLGRNRLNSLIKMSSRGVPREHISH